MPNKITLPVLASYVLAFVAGIVILEAGLLFALYAGLLVYSLVHLISPLVEEKIKFVKARIFVLAVLSFIVISLLTTLTLLAINFARSDSGNLHNVLQTLTGVIETARPQMPAWLGTYLPNSADELRDVLANWLRTNGHAAENWGQEIVRDFIHILIGMIIGGMIAIHDKPLDLPDFIQALQERAKNLQTSFQRIVFAQVRISAINTVFSAIYLLLILPSFGVHLPFAKTMVLITFLAGLLPVVGNIISNTIVVTVSITHSLQIALFSLLYMMFIHKLEYFLNAQIVGSQINARAWEILIAMLVMEALFGIPGLVSAPIFYAWLKLELGMGFKREPAN